MHTAITALSREFVLFINNDSLWGLALMMHIHLAHCILTGSDKITRSHLLIHHKSNASLLYPVWNLILHRFAWSYFFKLTCFLLTKKSAFKKSLKLQVGAPFSSACLFNNIDHFRLSWLLMNSEQALSKSKSILGNI